jgi:hypothetical protein
LKDPTFICLKESIYREFEIPALPFPVNESTLTNSLEKGVITFPEFMDDLIEYLEDNPEENEKYRPILSRICFQAGVDEGRAGRFENAHRYLTVALDNSYFKNVSVLQAYAYSCLKVEKYEEAIKKYSLAKLFTGMDRTFIPEIWIGLIISYFSIGDEKSGGDVLEAYVDELNKLSRNTAAVMYDKLVMMIKDERVKNKVIAALETKLRHGSV